MTARVRVKGGNTCEGLLNRYTPILQYDSHELFRATSVELMTSYVFEDGPGVDYANELRGDDGVVIATAGGDPPLSPSFLRSGKYETQRPVSREDFLDCFHNRARAADARAWHLAHAAEDLAYGRCATRNGGGLLLQYWFFYYFNDFEYAGIGIHEGDWEIIQIGLAADHVTPEVATFAQHRHGQALDWDEDIEKEAGVLAIDDGHSHPLVYVALGSHASYPTPGEHEGEVVRDTCDARGKRVQVRVELIDEHSPSWVLWPGRWGASREQWPKWFNSPRGPAFQDEKWKQPDRFHARLKRRRTDFFLFLPAPPSESIPVTVHAREQKVVIEFERPAGLRMAELAFLLDMPEGSRPLKYSVNVSEPGMSEARPEPPLLPQ